jgi:hypothetical protein
MSEVPARRWLKPCEAAEFLGCHVQSVYSGLLKGALPGVKISSVGWRLDRLELERRLERDIAEQAREAGR